MDSDLALQAAKRAADNIYHWIFGGQTVQTTAPSAAAAAAAAAAADASVKARLLSPSSVAASMASQVASFASSYVNSYFHRGQEAGGTAGNTHQQGTVNYREEKSAHSGHSNLERASNDILSKIFQTLRGGNSDHASSLTSSWKQWDPAATFDNLLWNYTPDVHKWLDRSGLSSFAEKYEIEPLVVLLALLLPLIMLSLCVCVLLIPASKDRPPSAPGRKSDPNLVGEKQSGSSNTGTAKHGGGGKGSSSSKSSSKKGKGASGGVQDTSDFSSSHVGKNVQLGGGQGLGSSWGSMLLASSGFLGADTLNMAPYGGLKGKNIGELIDGTVGKTAAKATDGASNTTDQVKNSSIVGTSSQGHVKAKNQGSSAAIGAQTHFSVGSIAEMELKKAQLESEKKAHQTDTTSDASHKGSASQHAEPGHESVFQKNNVANKNERAGHQRGQGAAGPDSHGLHTAQKVAAAGTTAHPTIPLRTHAVDHSGSTVTGQKISSTEENNHAPAPPKAARHNHAAVGRDLGSKIWGFAQGSQLLKNMDTFSGGILGSAVATVAALANTAEATATMLKVNLPDSVTDFTDELQDAFDHAMKTGGLDPRTSANAARHAEDNKNLGIRQAVSQIMDEDDRIAAEIKDMAQQTPAATHHTASTYASVASATKATAPNKATQQKQATATSTTTGAARRHSTEEIFVGPNVPKHVKTAEEVEASESEEDSASIHSSAHSTVNENSLSEINHLVNKGLKAPKSAVTSISANTALSEDSGDDADEEEDTDVKYDHDDILRDEDIQESGSSSTDDSDDLDDDENADDGSIPAHHYHHHRQHHARVHPHNTHHAVQGSGAIDVSHHIVDHKSFSKKDASTGGKKKNKNNKKTHQHEYTIDEHGNKVEQQAAAEERRDSGFDLLSRVHD